MNHYYKLWELIDIQTGNILRKGHVQTYRLCPDTFQKLPIDEQEYEFWIRYYTKLKIPPKLKLVVKEYEQTNKVIFAETKVL